MTLNIVWKTAQSQYIYRRIHTWVEGPFSSNVVAILRFNVCWRIDFCDGPVKPEREGFIVFFPPKSLSWRHCIVEKVKGSIPRNNRIYEHKVCRGIKLCRPWVGFRLTAEHASRLAQLGFIVVVICTVFFRLRQIFFGSRLSLRPFTQEMFYFLMKFCFFLAVTFPLTCGNLATPYC